MSEEIHCAGEPADPMQRRVITDHSVVRFTILRSHPRCPIFHTGDVFYVRQHVLDTETSSIRNFCFHTLNDVYRTYVKVRAEPVGSKKLFKCRDKGMVEMEVERMPDERSSIGRAEVIQK